MYYYKRIVNNEIVTVESYSHKQYIDGAERCMKKEYDDFIDTLPEPTVINHKAEIEKLSSYNDKLDYIINHIF